MGSAGCDGETEARGDEGVEGRELVAGELVDPATI